MSIQGPAGQPDGPRSPVFSSKRDELEKSGLDKPLGRVYYEEDEDTPLLSQSSSGSALSNRWVS